MKYSELCLKTAERFVDKVALYEYKSFASTEEPDVLVYGYSGTTLFEIKMSRSDFLADSKKACRRKYTSFLWTEWSQKSADPEVKRAWLRIKQGHSELFLKQAPHLGNRRFFVCEAGLVQPDEIPEGWGLYWFKGGKFFQKKISAKFRSNLKVENDLLIHSMRRYGSGVKTGIVINSYSGDKE